MLCNCNGWSSCGWGRQTTCGCGAARAVDCGCGRQTTCGCGRYEEDDFSLERVGSLPLFISLPTWLNGQNNGGSCGCG